MYSLIPKSYQAALSASIRADDASKSPEWPHHGAVPKMLETCKVQVADISEFVKNERFTLSTLNLF